jgi:hypothetical protein
MSIDTSTTTYKACIKDRCFPFGIYKTGYGKIKDDLCLSCAKRFTNTNEHCGYVGPSLSVNEKGEGYIVIECPGYKE